MSPPNRRPADVMLWPVRRTLDPRFADLARRLHELSEALHAATTELRGDIARSDAAASRAIAAATADTHGIRLSIETLTRQVGALDRRFSGVEDEPSPAAIARRVTVEREPPRAMADPPPHPGAPRQQAEIAARAGLPEAIVELYETQQMMLPDGSTLECFPMGIPVADAVVLQDLVRTYDRQRTLETGVGIGVSAAVIAAVHAQRGTGSHVAMDPYHREWFRGAAPALLERVGAASHVTLLDVESCVALAALEAAGRRFDFAFIDGNHHLDATLVDFYLVDRLLEPGGHLVFHDVWMEPVRRTLDFVLTNRDYVEEQNPDPQFLAVLRKEREDSRDWTFHDDAF